MIALSFHPLSSVEKQQIPIKNSNLYNIVQRGERNLRSVQDKPNYFQNNGTIYLITATERSKKRGKPISALLNLPW